MSKLFILLLHIKGFCGSFILTVQLQFITLPLLLHIKGFCGSLILTVQLQAIQFGINYTPIIGTNYVWQTLYGKN